MHFTFRWLCYVAAACLALPTHSQSAAIATAQKHTLWKVTGDHASVYLLGSVHVLKESDYPLAAPIETAFSNAAVVAFETDIAALDDPSVALKMMSKSRLPEGETLRKQLSPEVYGLWTSHLKQAGMPPELFEQLTPAMAAITIAVVEIQQLGLDPRHGVDRHYFSRARKAGKEIVPLESVEFQLNLVTEFTKDEGEALLLTTLKEMDSLKKEIGSLIKAWKTGDAPALEKLLTEARKESPAIYKRMLSDRNQSWLPKVEAIARGRKEAIVIVGAAHMVGTDGLPALLKKRGFTVTQL